VKKGDENVSKNVLMMSHGITGVTGFSNQLWLQSRALIENGYNVYVLHRDYRGEPLIIPNDAGVKTNSGRCIDGMTMLPIGGQQWGEDVIPFYLEKYKIDYVHTLGDIWCYQFLRNMPRTSGVKWLAHYVFDTENMVGFWNDSVKAADITVVPTKISYDMLTKLGHKNVQYVPHGVDTKIYKPATYEEKMEFRDGLGIPRDAFVIGMVAHNQYRKMVARLIDGFHKFLVDNPKSLLVLHCLPKDVTGWDLVQIIKDRGLTNNVVFTDKSSKGVADIHVPESELRKLYCAFDIHALSTGGEGFGIPIVEAMACGIPNVVTDYTSTREFLTDAVKSENPKAPGGVDYMNTRGIAVPYTEIEVHHTGGIWAKINTTLMAKAFQYIKDNEDEAKKMGMKAREYAVENYDNDVVKQKWSDLYSGFDSFVSGWKDNEISDVKRLKVVRI
jgi:glycosyltransferase involved in cell wall biosynthesis